MEYPTSILEQIIGCKGWISISTGLPAFDAVTLSFK